MAWITPCHQDTDFVWPLSLDDKITIFSEQTLGWQLDIANSCANDKLPSMRHAGWAVLGMVFSYFEMVGKMKHGYPKNDGESRCYFGIGLRDVFPELDEVHAGDIEEILWSSVRCALYHTGMAQLRIIISGDYGKDLQYDPTNRWVLINPHKLVPTLRCHFSQYITALREPANHELRANFVKRFDCVASFDPLEEKKDNRKDRRQLSP